jgi:elongation factor Tu
MVALNRADVGDPELLDLVELEVRELLERHGYPPADVAVVLQQIVRRTRGFVATAASGSAASARTCGAAR